jgi:hypothetical protein
MVAADQQVLRLEVAMNQARVVRRGQAFAGLPEHLDDLAPRSRLLRQPLPDGPTLDELHRDERARAERADAIDRDDVWAGQPRHRLRLAEQEPCRVELGGPQGLERHLAIERRIVGGVDDPHRAHADDVEHDVAIDQRTGSQIDARLVRAELRDELTAARTRIEMSVELRLGLRRQHTLRELGDEVLVRTPVFAGGHTRMLWCRACRAHR